MKKLLALLLATAMLFLCACGGDTAQKTPVKPATTQVAAPENMLPAFTDLYAHNPEVRGWISFRADGDEDFLGIEYPIVYSGDNSKYLNTDFDGYQNRTGTLFFDQNNKVDSYTDTNRALIVYGQNVGGYMFAGLNKLMGMVSNARSAATFTMSTLFREDAYKVFAVVLLDASDEDERRYDMWRTAFAGDGEFLKHVESIQARSLYDYPVDVEANDQIVVLSTSTAKSGTYVEDGRLLVVARRVRDGEDATVDTSAITKNTDVIMPYYWYVNQNKAVHQYYIDNDLDGDYVPQTTTTQTAPTGSGTYTTDPTQSAPSGSGGTSLPTASTTVTTTPTEPTKTTAPTAPTETTHTHAYDGCEDTACNGCGVTRDGGHKYTSKVVVAATCIEYGQIKHVCTVCNYQYTEMIEHTGEHTYDDGVCTGCGEEQPIE